MTHQPSREELIQKLHAARLELKHAGPIHRRDLVKHIHRMEKLLRYSGVPAAPMTQTT